MCCIYGWTFVIFLHHETLLSFSCSYPYGQPIKGEVTVQVTPRYKYEYLQAPYDAPVSFVKGIMGKTEFEMNLKDDLRWVNTV